MGASRGRTAPPRPSGAQARAGSGSRVRDRIAMAASPPSEGQGLGGLRQHCRVAVFMPRAPPVAPGLEDPLLGAPCFCHLLRWKRFRRAGAGPHSHLPRPSPDATPRSKRPQDLSPLRRRKLFQESRP